MHRAWIRQALAVIALASVIVPSFALAASPKALHQAGRWLVDADGRAVILHGLNQVNKLPPYLPSAIGFGADDAAVIASEGFNTVRTGMAHKGLVPAPGMYDSAYLDDFEATVDLLTAQGLYVLIDFHQDLYGERYQGNGMADWATVDSSPTDPTLLPACNLGFPGNIFSCPFLWEAFDRFLGLNGRPTEIGPRGITLQEEFADAWRQVATRFQNDPLVFGYNLLNEPYPGSSTPACLSLFGCPGTADAQLTVFSTLVAQAIREIDADTLVFYEPYATNFNAGFPTHHGDVDAGDVGLSFHLYACPTVPNQGPTPVSAACRTREQSVFTNAETQSQAFAHAPLLTEFGATNDLLLIESIAELADANMMGWQYWAWWNRDPCCERPDEGVIDDPANPATPEHLDQAKLDTLVRPFPRAVAGTPTGWSWDRVARRFTLAYATTPVDGPLTPGAVTEVWIPQRHFPTGYDVVGLKGATVTSANDAERLELVALPGATTVSFAVVPPACGPAPALGCRQQVQSNRGTFALTGKTTAQGKDHLAWSWVNGAATTLADFGDPTVTTSYRLCAYDETAGVPQLVLSSGVASGGTCDGHPCWRASKTGFRYKDPSASAEGVRQVVLKAGAAGRSKIQVRAQGDTLTLPGLPFQQDPKVTVQLRSSTGQCWEAAYSTPAKRNTADRFKDRGN
ncbi:MAG: cellulase family glycosylhydrolase [Candidatus Binatia bacterium]